MLLLTPIEMTGTPEWCPQPLGAPSLGFAGAARAAACLQRARGCERGVEPQCYRPRRPPPLAQTSAARERNESAALIRDRSDLHLPYFEHGNRPGFCSSATLRKPPGPSVRVCATRSQEFYVRAFQVGDDQAQEGDH